MIRPIKYLDEATLVISAEGVTWCFNHRQNIIMVTVEPHRCFGMIVSNVCGTILTFRIIVWKLELLQVQMSVYINFV